MSKSRSKPRKQKVKSGKSPSRHAAVGLTELPQIRVPGAPVSEPNRVEVSGDRAQPLILPGPLSMPGRFGNVGAHLADLPLMGAASTLPTQVATSANPSGVPDEPGVAQLEGPDAVAALGSDTERPPGGTPECLEPPLLLPPPLPDGSDRPVSTLPSWSAIAPSSEGGYWVASDTAESESEPSESQKPVDATRAPYSDEGGASEATDPPPSTPFVVSPTVVDSVPASPTPSPEPPTWQPPPGPLRPGIPSMYIVQVSSELAPVAKVGGLADVVFGLSRELEIRGHRVELILPKYDCMRYDHIWGLTVCYQDLMVPWGGGHIQCTVWYGEVYGRKCFFIEPHSQENFFNRRKFYGDNDDALRFAFFSRAALEFMYKSGRHPDIIHCHDWQTGILPVYLYEFYQQLGMGRSRVCYTIHNFRHQGVTGDSLLAATELGRPWHFLHPDRMQDPRHPTAINLMKAGIVYSNFITTVSPNYAWEAKTNQGFGLERTLQTHQAKYGGVVNGVDYDIWNPEIDHYLPVRYSAYSVERKYDNKRALRNRFWLADCAKPIIAFIGRLDEQKGLELIQQAAWWATRNSAQFVLLGTAPEARVGGQFWELKRRLNDNPDCHIELSFDEELSHLIYAGADLMLVPSRYEPCGLTQLIALKYGTIPVVRAIGGLADTVFDKDFDYRPLDQRNGFVFGHYDPQAVETTLARAVSCYYHFPEHFRAVMLNGMRADYSWNFPGQHYLNIYDYIRAK